MRANHYDNMVPMHRDPLPCPECGVDSCELCHACTRALGEMVLFADCICEEMESLHD